MKLFLFAACQGLVFLVPLRYTYHEPSMSHKIRIERVAKDGVAVNTEVEWLYAQDPATKHFVAVCPKLNITLEADSLNELLSLIPESVDGLFKTLIKKGDLHAFLCEMNWDYDIGSTEKSAARFEPPLPRINPVLYRDLQHAACG
jgi:hypothetical protein